MMIFHDITFTFLCYFSVPAIGHNLYLLNHTKRPVNIMKALSTFFQRYSSLLTAQEPDIINDINHFDDNTDNDNNDVDDSDDMEMS